MNICHSPCHALVRWLTVRFFPVLPRPKGLTPKPEYTLCFYRDGGYVGFGPPPAFLLTGAGPRYQYVQSVVKHPVASPQAEAEPPSAEDLG